MVHLCSSGFPHLAIFIDLSADFTVDNHIYGGFAFIGAETP
ncbi:hypothetical protein B194_0967 [Serratia plymuthica A30]|nr:hypothetical protein B194_0967 [Serratia plymuthica A30]